MKVPLPLSSCLPTCSIALAALFLLLPMASPAAGLQPPDACGAARFDGSQTKLMVGGDGIIAGTFTVEMWVKPDDLAGGRGLLGSRFTPNEYGFDLKLNGGSQVQADIGNGSGWAVSPAIAEFNYQTDSWVYVAYVVTPTNYTIYADGKRVGGGQYPLITPLLRDAAHHLYLGWTGFGSEFFKGEIAEVRLWNHALTARRIGNIWQRPLRLPQPGLVLCYRFTEGAGDTVHDLSGNGNHGTVVNGIGWSRPNLPADAVSAVLTFPEVRYAAKLSDDEARFHLNVQAEATAAGSATLFEGDVALLPAKLPDSLKIVREGNRYRLVAARAGHFKFDLDLVAKIQRADPWNQISFTGPAATIGAITAAVGGADTEVQLLEGTVLESARTNDAVQLTGFLGADRTVALRWQSKIAQVAHKALLTVDSTISAQVTPTVIKYTSRFHYDIVQGSAPELTLTLPAAQALTHLDGAQIRDWHLAVDGTHQTLTVAFIKPVENSYDLTVSTEQSVDAPDTRTVLDPPQPQNVERESGSLTLSAEDELVDISAPAGLHQVNAPDNAVAAYEFNARPLTLALALKPIEPVVNVADRVSAQLEETRLTVSHRLSLDVQKAGIYTLELAPPEGFAVADVRGDGIEDWNVSGGKIHVNFTARILGARELTVQLEQALKNFPDNIAIAPLRVTGAAKATAQIGAASAPGIQLRTAQLNGLREIPASRLANRSNEILAYTADQPDWSLSIASEKLPPRIVADVFNLVTIGDGIVGGSATIRYGLVGQGVQEFKIAVPTNFKNVDFTGPNIRNKEFADGVWTISLQDKVWGGYTLVVTYDYPFDAKSATLPVAGIHAVNAERESGSIAITTAASLQLNPAKVSDSLRRVDESELSAADRSFISRAVVLAYQYNAESYELTVDARRYAEESVLDAVADRTQITSVLTDAGEMLTQASFMVKNNEKQFQRFELPAGATLWGCYVNGQPAKAERDGAWVLVPLPRDADRDQASGVDILYAQTNGVASTLWGKSLALNAPRTDVPST
ncbi:MAG TPA: LamG domain-containing protein, partial [Verrucomicrobiae bacterium]|nr:LamG domain-containing protein [Verrucomicrobiae bacterium]